jgi:hypothetical protein
MKPVKILIDPFYVNGWPYHLLPRILLSKGAPLKALSRLLPGDGLGPLPRWAFGPGGFDGMDLGFSYTRLLRPDLSLRDRVVARYRRSRWPVFAFHATFGGGARLFADTAMELSEGNERARRGLRSQIQAAAAISGRGAILVVHLGAVLDSARRSLERALRVLSDVLPEAEERGVILALENMPSPVRGRYYLGADYRDLQRALRDLPSPCLKVCFDWGHANQYAGLFAEQTGKRDVSGYRKTFGYCREMVEELGPEIVYAHIHYNRSHCRDLASAGPASGDEHMPLNRIPPEELPAFSSTLRLLFERSSIRETGRVNLELIPRRVFGRYPVFPTGSSRCEQMASLGLLRALVEEQHGPSFLGWSCSLSQEGLSVRHSEVARGNPASP